MRGSTIHFPNFGTFLGKTVESSDSNTDLTRDPLPTEPAAVAMTIVKEGVAWIGWVATRAESRGRGLGRLSTTAATRAGFELGARFASLEATKMGAPIYLRLGYQQIVNYRNYWSADLQV